MDGRELRRSYTQVEFPVSSRVRSHHPHMQQVRPLGRRYQQQQQQQQQMTTTAARAKFPTMEIYRPPNMRDKSSGEPVVTSTSSGKLNVYAKEFVMSTPLQPSKSTGSILTAVEDSTKRSILNHKSHQLQHHHNHHQHQHSRGVQWIDEKLWQDGSRPMSSPSGGGSPLVTNPASPMMITTTNNNVHSIGRDLKRSKSTGSPIHHSIAVSCLSPTSATTPLTHELTLFDGHPAEKIVRKACTSTDVLTCEELMELPRHILEKALEDRAHAQSYATISMCVIEREPCGTFLESLLNICQFTCERKKSHKGGGGGDHGLKYHSFMAFLNELYSQMKPKHSHLRLCTGSSPTHTVLSLIVQVCQALLSQKNLTARPEIECLFFTVTTVGRDLEMEDPRLLDSLMWAVRDAFLSPGTSQPNKQTLLQLIELKAAKWHLPASTIMYYKNHAQI